MRVCCFIALVLMAHQSSAQPPDISKVSQWRAAHEPALMQEFKAFLTIPNVASDSIDIPRNAAFIRNMMQERGIANIQLLSGPAAGYPPAVYGEVLVPGATRTIGLYAHYDGQPVNPAQWAPGLAPFTPTLYDGPLFKGGKPIPFPSGNDAQYQPEWRIYARGASDDKAGVFAILSAYAALEGQGIAPTSNIKFLFEGEEEAGSIHLGDIFQAHADLLKADCWIICDGPVHQTGRKQIVFGVRGDTHLDLTVYGPKRPLHSGHYGNWANNPALLLARLLASMKDDSGRVTIQGFYDDVRPLSPLERAALAEVPSVDEQMKAELGISTTEMTGKNLSEAINLPSLNINGMQSGNVGAQASNQIPTYATAVLDLRLVLGNDWRRQQQKVIDHIRREGFTVLDHDPTDAERLEYPRIIKVLTGTGSYNAQRTPMDLPIAMQIKAALQSTTSDPVVLQPTMGGSLPLYLFEQYLHAPTITVPIANHDNNQHAENENLRLANLWSGIESMAAMMTMAPPAPTAPSGASTPPRSSPKSSTPSAALISRVSADSLKANLLKIAGPGTDGRMAGSKGDEAAVKYIARTFKDHHLATPYHLTKPFLQSVSLVNVDFPTSTLRIDGKRYAYNKDWTCFSDARNASIPNAEVVFIGYGLSTPAYDDLKDIDIAGKMVLLQFGMPVDSTGRPLIPDSQMPGDNATINAIMNKKPLGLLVFGENTVHDVAEFKAFHPFEDLRDPDASFITGAIITKSLAEVILHGNVDSIYKLIGRSGRSHSFNTHSRISLSIVETDKRRLSANVIGMIAGTDTSLPCIVVTAHHDHEGIVNGKTYYGADDNGTGTAAMLEIARILGDAKTAGVNPKRTIVFISTAAEEQGLIGSSWYAAHPALPLSKTRCSINMDMMGRVDSFYSGRRPDSNYVYEIYKDLPGETFSWDKLKFVDDLCCSLKIDTMYNPKKRTATSAGLMTRADNFPFAKAGIPTLWFFGGFHHDYHEPTDTWDKIDFPLFKARTQLVLATLWRLAND